MRLSGTPVIVHTRAGVRTGVITSETSHGLSVILAPARVGAHVLITHDDGSSTHIVDRPQPEQLDISRENIVEDDQSGQVRKITLK